MGYVILLWHSLSIPYNYFAFLKNHRTIFNQILYVIFRYMHKEMKINQHDAGHMTKMADMPIYCINRNQWVDFDETWYEASEIQAHYIGFK